MIQKHLKKSAELSVGRRDNSYEWYATEPHWCPLVNARELGGWVDQKNFFQDTSKLAFVEGTISSLKRTAGIIRIGDVTRAFFRPPSHLRESEHINAKVHFVLGFSYERLHAWLVDLGPAPVSTVTVPKKLGESVKPLPEAAANPPPSGGFATPFANLPPIRSAEDSGTGDGARSPAPISEGDALRSAALLLIKSLLEERTKQLKKLTIALIGNKLRDHFSEPVPLHERLGFHSVRALVESCDEFQTFRDGLDVIIEFKVSASTQDAGDLRREIAAVIASLIDASERKGRILQLPTVGAELGKRFPGDVPLFRRLRLSNLTALIRSYGDFEVVWQDPRWVVRRHGQTH